MFLVAVEYVLHWNRPGDFRSEAAFDERKRENCKSYLKGVSAVLPASGLVAAKPGRLVQAVHGRALWAAGWNRQEPGGGHQLRRSDARISCAGWKRSGHPSRDSLERWQNLPGKRLSESGDRQGEAFRIYGKHLFHRIYRAEDFVDEKQRAGELCTDQKDHAAEGLPGISSDRRTLHGCIGRFRHAVIRCEEPLLVGRNVWDLRRS